MPFLRLLLCATCIISALSLYAQSNTLPIDTSIRIGQLDNGLHYYIKVNSKPEDRAALRLVVKAGSLQEDENQRGLAHFVEHMAFNGSAHFEKNELINYLEKTGTRFGADLNAYTSFEETVYQIEARTDSLQLLETALLILEDWSSALSFDENEIDKERGVVVSEWRTSLSPDQRLQQAYFPILYQDSRYAQRLPIGKTELIENALPAVIRKYYEDWYRPDLMAVVAVGDFDPDWMESEIKKRFSKLENPQNARKRETYTIPSHDTTLFAIVTDKEAPFTQIRIVYKHQNETVADSASLRKQLIHRLYNKMLNARLQELQLQAEPPFTFAYSGYGSDLGDLATYTIYAFVKKGQEITGLEAVLSATYQALQHGFKASELDRQKIDILKTVEQAVKEKDKMPSSSIANRCVYHFLEDNPLMSLEQRYALYKEILPGIQLGDINPMPKQWLRDENRVVIMTGPEDSKPNMPKEQDILQLLDRIANTPTIPYEDNINDEPLLDEIPPVKPVKKSKHLGHLSLTELELENGIKVYLKPTDFQNEEILMSAFSPGGHSLYPDDLYPSASSAAVIANQSGIADFTALELQKKLTGKQVSVGPYIGELFEGIGGSCTPDELEDLFQLVYLYFTNPRLDSTALASYVSRQSSIFENLTVNPYYYFADQRSKIKYNKHPRRQITTLEELSQLNLKEIEKVYRERFADANDFTFVFVGNFSVAQIQPFITQYLGNLPVLDGKEKWKDVGANLIKGTHKKTITKGEAPKAIVEMTYHSGFDYKADKRYAFNSMIAALRIRLRENLREEKGGVYGVKVSGIVLPYPTPRYKIDISFNCEPARVEELKAEIDKVVTELQTIGVDKNTLTKIKETQRQNRIKGLKENNYWLGQLETRLKYNIPLEGIIMENFDIYVNSLSSRMIQDASKVYLKKDNYIELILMPEE